MVKKREIKKVFSKPNKALRKKCYAAAFAAAIASS